MDVKFSVSPLFVVLVCVLIYMGYFEILLCYLITIFLHEGAHAYVASKLGYKLNNIHIMPHGVSIGGANVYFSHRDEIYIAMAGPILNIILCVVGVAMWWVIPMSYTVTEYFVWANIGVALVNVLPIFPLDGGRIMLGLLSTKYRRKTAQKVMQIIGIILSSMILILFVLSTFWQVNFTMLMLGSFLFVISIVEDKMNNYTSIATVSDKMSRLGKGVKIRNVAVLKDMTLYKLYRETAPNYITNFVVLGQDMEVIGQIKEAELEKLLTLYPATTTLGMVM
ncbi:MAG: site-2 protease family protein [Clostridia bacterium]|nr:site-2 protease family protein [Clostridia bacterium]